MDAQADPPEDAAPVGTDNTDPLPVIPGSWAAVSRDWEAATMTGAAAGPMPPPHPSERPTTLPPFDFSAVEMNRAPARRRRALILAATGLVAVAALGAVGFTVLGAVGFTVLGADDEGSSAAATAEDADSARDSGAEERLLARLPGGYPDSACQAVEPPQGTVAQVLCEATSEPQAPAATYTLVADEESLTAAFDRLTKRSSVVVCPGRIQSPGPWRRNATPDVVSGVVLCAASKEATTVGWTDEASLLLSEIRSEPGSRNLEQLFEWWSSHS